MKNVILQDLIGKTFDVVERKYFKGNEGVIFKSKDKAYMLVHLQCCCEDIELNDIVGDLSDLENSEIIKAEQRQDVIHSSSSDYWRDSIYWTFYEIATNKGAVTIKFCGEDNYYSVDVDLIEIAENGEYKQISYDDDD